MIGLKKFAHRAARTAGCLSAALAASAAMAVNDLPGGPAVNQLDLHPPATRIALDIHNLHVGLMVVCMAIFVAVFGFMFYSILKHRKSKGAKAAHFHESVAVEIAWTVVPMLIVIGMGAAATKSVVEMKDTTNADITIKATGYQWKWGFRRFPFPNVSYGEDYAAALRISRDYRVGRIFKPLYLCRRWEGNSDANLSYEQENRYAFYKDSLRTQEILERIRAAAEKGAA